MQKHGVFDLHGKKYETKYNLSRAELLQSLL